jgi:hypothetical protein
MALNVLLVREGTRLAAADPISAEAIAGIALRETVTASIRRSRNPRHHAKLFALLNIVFQQQDQFATVQDLLGAIKLATGYFDLGKTIDGIPYCVPKSIALASMAQTEFEQFYDKAVQVILTKILPNINRDDLERQVHEILDGYSR